MTVTSSVASIGPYAFSGCTALAQLSLAEGLETIGESAFAGCGGLTEVTVPPGVTGIGDRAFSNCAALVRVSVPASVTGLTGSVFVGSGSLASVEVSEDNPSYSETVGVIFEPGQQALVFFPAGQTGPYTVPDGVAVIGPHADEQRAR